MEEGSKVKSLVVLVCVGVLFFQAKGIGVVPVFFQCIRKVPGWNSRKDKERERVYE